MLKIIELIIEYKETRSEKSASEIIKIILPMINNKVKNIRLDYREDVIQELKMNLFSIIEIAVFKDIDFPNELFTLNNLKILSIIGAVSQPDPPTSGGSPRSPSYL